MEQEEFVSFQKKKHFQSSHFCSSSQNYYLPNQCIMPLYNSKKYIKRTYNLTRTTGSTQSSSEMVCCYGDETLHQHLLG